MKNENKQMQAFQLIRKAEKFIERAAYPEAELLLKDAIELDATNPEGFYLLGEALCKQQKFGESIVSLEMADTLLPKNPEIIHLLGWASFMNGSIDEGRKLMELSLHQMPDEPRFLCDLAVLEMRENNNDTAFEYAKKAIDNDPNDPMAMEVFQIVSQVWRVRNAYTNTVN